MNINNDDKTQSSIKFDRYVWDEVKEFTDNKATMMIIPKFINGVVTCQVRTKKGYITIKEGEYIVKKEDDYYRYSSEEFKQLSELSEI